MRPEDADLGYAWDMREAAREVSEFTRGASQEQYATNKMMRRAVDAVRSNYAPALAGAVLTRLKEWAEGAGMKNAVAIVALTQKNNPKNASNVSGYP